MTNFKITTLKCNNFHQLLVSKCDYRKSEIVMVEGKNYVTEMVITFLNLLKFILKPIL